MILALAIMIVGLGYAVASARLAEPGGTFSGYLWPTDDEEDVAAAHARHIPARPRDAVTRTLTA